MTSFAQKSTTLTTFYQLAPGVDLQPILLGRARVKKPVLIVPALASEFSDPENRPIFENIVAELGQAPYLRRIIFGLDQAHGDEARLLKEILDNYGLKNYFIQWNDGPTFSGLYDRLEQSGLDLSVRGKGRNLFMGSAVAMALGAGAVGILDADIKTFKKEQLDRLFYPVLALDYQFSKAFYARVGEGRLYGRIKRLLLDPLLLALKRKFDSTREDRMTRLIDFLLSFDYQLSGEVVMDVELLKRMRSASHWGIEIFTLIEAWRKAKHVAQVEFTTGVFDHKHQAVSQDDPGAGLNKMAIDITTTMFKALIVDEGLDVSNYFFRDLALVYTAIAEDLIRKYSENASFNGLPYDRDAEEVMVHQVFAKAVRYAGFILDSPTNISDNIIRFVSAHDDFNPYLQKGFIRTMNQVEKKLRQDVYWEYELPSWERVQEKDPDFLSAVSDLIEAENSGL